jgi:hypothetical protein
MGSFRAAEKSARESAGVFVFNASPFEKQVKCVIRNSQSYISMYHGIEQVSNVVDGPGFSFRQSVWREMCPPLVPTYGKAARRRRDDRAEG